MISVIVPVYNKEKQVYKCLSSIIAQEFSELEIIIVYYEGADRSLDEIMRIHDDRLRIIHQNSPTGPGGARNIGIREARGDFIGFVDCDDYIPVDYYKKLYDQITQYDADIAIANIVIATSAMQMPFSCHRGKEVLSDFYEKYATVQNGAVFDKLFKRSLLHQNGIIFPEGVFWEDNLFILKAYYFSRNIILCPEVSYVYCWEEKSHAQNIRLRQDVLVAAQGMLDFCAEKDFSQRTVTLVKKKILRSFLAEYITDISMLVSVNTVFGMSSLTVYYYVKNKIKLLMSCLGVHV